MRTIHSAGFVLLAMMLAASCGCSSAPTITRGQNPITDSAVTSAGHTGSPTYGTAHGYQPAPLDAMADHQRYTDISRYEVDQNGQVLPYGSQAHAQQVHSRATSGCPTCPPNPNCPHCQGHPAYGQPCPACQCRDDGSHDYPQHHFTYSYIRPKNLLYPPPQVPGGAVVYPYYTHKGPSDFFRAH